MRSFCCCSCNFWRQSNTPKSFRSVIPPSPRRLGGYLTNHTLLPFPPPGPTYSEILPQCADHWVGLGKERMLAEFRGALLRSPGNPTASGSRSKTGRKKKENKEEKTRLAHRGGRRTAAGDFGSAPSGSQRTHGCLLPAIWGPPPALPPEPGTPPEPLLHQTEHRNFKMVPGARGLERVARGRGWGGLNDAHTAGQTDTRQRRREKWNAAPLRGLHGAPGPGASLLPPARCVGPFLGENYPQTRSPEASLTPGPPGPATGRQLLLTPLSAASSQLSATSSSSILLAAFPPPPTPPRACALKRASVAGGGTQGFPQWTTPPHPARKGLPAKP